MSKLEDREFYVYEHWRPDTGLPFYVGKGKGTRAFSARRGRHHRNVVGKLKRLGFAVEVRKVFTHLDEETAFILEKAQIAYWRFRGIKLANLTDGGEGSSGFRPSKEVVQRRNASIRKAHTAPSVKEKKSLAARRKLAEPGVLENRVAAMNTTEAKAKGSATYARLLASSPEVKARLIAVLNRPDVVAKRIAAATARFATEEFKEKRRVKIKARFKNDPEYKASIVIGLKRIASTPELLAKRNAAIKAALNRPEVKEKFRALMKLRLEAKQKCFV